jgi:hypothetical protein
MPNTDGYITFSMYFGNLTRRPDLVLALFGGFVIGSGFNNKPFSSVDTSCFFFFGRPRLIVL